MKNRSVEERNHGSVGGDVLPGASEVVGRLGCVVGEQVEESADVSQLCSYYVCNPSVFCCLILRNEIVMLSKRNLMLQLSTGKGCSPVPVISIPY